jgi:hypothetical protein
VPDQYFEEGKRKDDMNEGCERALVRRKTSGIFRTALVRSHVVIFPLTCLALGDG